MVEKLDEVTTCWRAKFARSALPNAWNALVPKSGDQQPAATIPHLSSRQQAFEHVYDKRIWARRGKSASLSGTGSDLEKTFDARAALMVVLLKHRLSRVIDAPCGDLTWMRTLFPALESLNVAYLGVDVVRPQIERHQANFAKPGVRSFMVADLVAAPLPAQKGDVIFCRQALQHLNAYDALRVLHQFSRSGARLLLTTSYELHRDVRFFKPDENYAPQKPGPEVCTT